MKHKIFLTIILLVFTFGTLAMAEYVEPTSTAPSSNTGDVLRTGPRTTKTTVEKIGTWEFAKNPPDSTGLAEYAKSADLLKDSTYVGDETHKKGLFSEKLTVLGVSKIISGDLITMVDNKTGSSFDQFMNSTSYLYPLNANSTTPAKPLEGIITGRMLGQIALTDKEDDFDPFNRKFNPAYSLDLLATNTSSFNPTTNIGLGDSCNLYPADIGTSIGGGGGCPAGSYITYYKKPTFSGAITSTNNTNSQVVATCTQFNPSMTPKNTGRCPVSNDPLLSLNQSQIYLYCGFGNEYSNVLNDCPTLVQHRLKGSNNSWTYGKPSDMDDTCNSQSKYEVSVTNNCYYNGGISVNYANTSLPNHSVGSPTCSLSLAINNKRLKMPTTLSGNIKWYDSSGNWLNSSFYNDKTKMNDCTPAKAIVTDLYGQFVEKTK